MTVHQLDRDKIEAFFSEIEPFSAAYRHKEIRYLAIRDPSGSFVVFHGVLELSAFNKAINPKMFQTADIIAEVNDLNGLEMAPDALIERLIANGITLQGRGLSIPPEPNGTHRTHLWNFDGGEIDTRHAEGQLTISGATHKWILLQNPELLRQLRTSSTPYDNLFELARDFRLDLEYGMNPHFDFCARRVAEIQPTSALDGSRATIHFRVAADLDRSGQSLSVAIKENDGAVLRSMVGSHDIDWCLDQDGHQVGTAVLAVNDAKIVECILSYGGRVQHRAKFVQPVHQLNSLRFAYDLFDTGTKGLVRVVTDQKVTNRDGRELELTVLSLLGMHGFATVALDRIPHVQEIPDIIAADHRGNLLVVECTLGMPNADNKLSDLYRKSHAIQDALLKIGRQDIQVVSVLATPRTAEELNNYRAEAVKLGILFWSRDDLEKLIRDRSEPNADIFYDRVMSTWRQNCASSDCIAASSQTESYL